MITVLVYEASIWRTVLEKTNWSHIKKLNLGISNVIKLVVALMNLIYIHCLN